MTKRYCFNQNEIENIINRFGEDFYEKVLRDIEVYADKWSLTSFQFIPSYSANLVFICCSKDFGNVVLKIGNSSFGEIFTELLGNDGEYIIIDPKGVIGDPVFDVPRFILNEFGDEITTELYKKINDIICIFEKNLNIPNHILKQCLYVETAMGICWSVEDGSTPEEYPSLIKNVAFAETILNTNKEDCLHAF